MGASGLEPHCLISDQIRMGIGFRVSVLTTSLILLAACAPGFNPGEAEVAQKIEESIGCANFRDETFTALYEYLDQQQEGLSEKTVADELKAKILNLPSANQELKRKLADEVAHLISLLNSETIRTFNSQSNADHLQKLIELEFQNSSTESHKIANDKIQQSFQKISELAKQAEVSCQNPGTEVTPLVTGVNHPLYGARFAFTTAYQTCESLDLPPMDAKTEDVKGIRIGAANGAGFKREYASIPDIARTHYYINRANYHAGCFEVNKRPLVYDFGGQPSVQTSKNLIDFFTNSGSGGNALGIDCSAFVSSGLAVAGLRYTPGVSNKPIYIRQSSGNFINPQTSGWKCFARIPVTAQKSLAPGDIMAVQGHVVWIDEVGTDPFGIAKLTNVSQCSKLSVTDFDFVIMQSSPSKSSIGINRYEASVYLAEASDKMKSGFLKYAKATCQAKFDGKTYTPGDSTVGIIRHKGTPECIDKRVQMAYESCTASCPQLRE